MAIDKIKIRFWLRKQQTNTQGRTPLYFYIRINGKKSKDHSTGIFIFENDWCSTSQIVKNNSEANEQIQEILQSIKSEIQILKRKNQTINLDLLEAQIKNKKTEQITVLQLCNEYIKHQSDCKIVTSSTIRTYQIRQVTLVQFLKSIKNENICADSFNHVTAYQLYSFALKKGAGNNYSMKIVQYIKQAFAWAYKTGKIEKNEIEKFDFKYTDTAAPIWLTKEEREKIIHAPITNERMKQVREVFLFMCYTGMAWTDIDTFNPNIHLHQNNGIWCIKKKRVKTGTVFFVPLRAEAVDLLKNWLGDNITRNNKIPVLSNQKFNSYLKVLADMCDIKKKISTHTARKTFGNMLINEEGIDVFTVSQMLGHTTVKQTLKEYVHISETKVLRDMATILNKTA